MSKELSRRKFLALLGAATGGIACGPLSRAVEPTTRPEAARQNPPKTPTPTQSPTPEFTPTPEPIPTSEPYRSVLWSLETAASPIEHALPPAFAEPVASFATDGKNLFINNVAGGVAQIDPETGSTIEVWQDRGFLLHADDLAFAVHQDGLLYALEPGSLKTRWKLAAQNNLFYLWPAHTNGKNIYLPFKLQGIANTFGFGTLPKEAPGLHQGYLWHSFQYVEQQFYSRLSLVKVTEDFVLARHSTPQREELISFEADSGWVIWEDNLSKGHYSQEFETFLVLGSTVFYLNPERNGLSARRNDGEHLFGAFFDGDPIFILEDTDQYIPVAVADSSSNSPNRIHFVSKTGHIFMGKTLDFNNLVIAGVYGDSVIVGDPTTRTTRAYVPEGVEGTSQPWLNLDVFVNQTFRGYGNTILAAEDKGQNPVFYGLDLETGETIWRAALSGKRSETPILEGQTAYILTGNKLHVVDVPSGEMQEHQLPINGSRMEKHGDLIFVEEISAFGSQNKLAAVRV